MTLSKTFFCKKNIHSGNNLIEFLHALQYAKDYGRVVGIMRGSWPTRLITEMWMAVQGPENLSRHSQERTNSIVEWSANFEKAFCVKIIQSYDDLDEYKEVIQMDTKELFKLEHDLSIGGFDDYVKFQSHNIRKYIVLYHLSCLQIFFSHPYSYLLFAYLPMQGLFSDIPIEDVGLICKTNLC